MAQKKRRKNKKQQAATKTIIVMLVIIFAIIGFFIIKALGDKEGAEFTESDTTKQNSVYTDWGGESGETTSSISNESEENTETETTEEITSETETQTVVSTSPVNVDNESVSDKIIVHYAELLGISKGELYINESEVSSNGDIYTYALRTKSGSSPNKLIGDIRVDIGSGDVTDSMGNEMWNINS